MNMYEKQENRNEALLKKTRYLAESITSEVVPFQLDPRAKSLTDEQITQLKALSIDAARIAIESVGSLSKLNEVDHLGGGLDLIPALSMTLAMTDYDKIQFTIENAHTSAGYYGVLSAFGFLDREDVIETFRRGLDIPGHVSWVPGGTQLNGGRLGVMIPAAVGQALGMKAYRGEGAAVICHCGDAGWISGQALNGFNAADAHGAPVIFVMHRNGIQLSGTNARIMDKDPRPIIASLGIEIIEISSLHDPAELFNAYRQAYALACQNRPSMIYPVGYHGKDLNWFGEQYGVTAELEAFAKKQGVEMNTRIWAPGALMSYGDLDSMFECLFFVNNLPGGKGHHDGHLKGRDAATVLANPLMALDADETAALEALRAAPPRVVVTDARPAAGSDNLILSSEALAAVSLPEAGRKTSARAGVQVGYEVVAKAFPDRMFVVDCDLAPSTKVDKARAVLDDRHQFEMSIEEQVSAIMANGLSTCTNQPQLIVFGTFAAFFEGIAREGFEMWRYQRNLNGVNEGLNVTFHLSHVGACTGRDHFSGWALDWINLGLGYLPYLDRFYAPADARAAFIAIRDLAARYGAHIIAVPRDNLPVLAKQDGSDALWEADTPWEAVTAFRQYDGAKKAILAFGAPAFLAEEAAAQLVEAGEPTDVYVINGLPLPEGRLAELAAQYGGGLITIEDGLIGVPESGVMGFAGLVASSVSGIPLAHLGITDPRIAPSEGHMEVWEHFGLTTEALVEAVRNV